MVAPRAVGEEGLRHRLRDVVEDLRELQRDEEVRNWTRADEDQHDRGPEPAREGVGETVDPVANRERGELSDSGGNAVLVPHRPHPPHEEEANDRDGEQGQRVSYKVS